MQGADLGVEPSCAELVVEASGRLVRGDELVERLRGIGQAFAQADEEAAHVAIRGNRRDSLLRNPGRDRAEECELR